MADEKDEGTATPPEIDNPTPDPPKVENPEAVLAKNKELLGKLASEKAEREALAARVAEFEKKQTDDEQKRLEKRGEWEKLRETMEASHKTALETEHARYQTLFANSARFELAVELGKHEILDGTAERLAKLLLLDEIRPVEEKDKVVWRKITSDEEVKLNEFIPSIKEAYGEYFKADNNPGSDAPGNTGKVNTAGKKWDTMTRDEKNAAIREHRGDAAAAKKKYN